MSTSRVVYRHTKTEDRFPEEVRMIEEWHTLPRPTRLRRWDLLDRRRRQVLTDAYGPELFRP